MPHVYVVELLPISPSTWGLLCTARCSRHLAEYVTSRFYIVLCARHLADYTQLYTSPYYPVLKVLILFYLQKKKTLLIRTRNSCSRSSHNTAGQSRYTWYLCESNLLESTKGNWIFPTGTLFRVLISQKCLPTRVASSKYSFCSVIEVTPPSRILLVNQ